MNRQEFMNQLERLLYALPAEERADALQYYNDYFDDAGPEREQEIIRELISPEHVAGTIMDGMKEQAGSMNGRDGQNQQNQQNQWNSQSQQNQWNSQSQQNQWNGQNRQNEYQTQGGYHYDDQNPQGNAGKFKMPVWGWVLLILTAPVTVPVIFSVIGTIFGCFMAMFGILLGCLVGGIGLFIGAVTLLATGFSGLGFVCLGLGFLLECFAFLLIPFDIWLIGSAIPGVYHFVKRLVCRLLGKGGSPA